MKEVRGQRGDTEGGEGMRRGEEEKETDEWGGGHAVNAHETIIETVTTM